MRRLVISFFITTGLTTIGISAFAETGQQIEEIANMGEVTDNSNFLTIKDDKGEANLIKTIAVLKFGEDHLRLEIGNQFLRLRKRTLRLLKTKTYLNKII